LITWDDFAKVDMRVGRIIGVEDFERARKPAWKLRIDLGSELGVKSSSAQLKNYPAEVLEGRLVVCVVNFPPRQVGPFMSEVLVLGALDESEGTVLLQPDSEVAVGDRIG
jgi:tRNA-binding protein